MRTVHRDGVHRGNDPSRAPDPRSPRYRCGAAITAGSSHCALSQAHAASIIHRDLKPANAIVTDDGTLKVLDFGLAKALQTTSGGDAPPTTALSISEPRAVVGTVPYMSPEQALGGQVDQRSDLFSFGIVLHEMVTGRHPFAHDSQTATLAAILNSEVRFPERNGSPVERALEGIITRCLVKDRDKRYQTIELVKQDLREGATAGRAFEQTHQAARQCSSERPPSWSAWPHGD